MDHVNALAKFEGHSFTHSWDKRGVLGGVANPQSWATGGRRGSGMVLFERALLRSYRPSIVTFPYLYAFRRYCRFCALVDHFSPPHLKYPQNFPVFPWEYVDGLWATKSKGVGLIAVQLFSKISNLCDPDPPMLQMDNMQSQHCTLHYSASHGKNWN